MNLKIQTIVLTFILTSHPFSNIFSQNVSFNEYLVDNQFEGPAGLFVKDVDSNGFNDIISAGSSGNEVCVWLNNGDSPITWSKEMVDDNFLGAIYIFAEDIDGDNKIDLVGAGWDANQVAWWKNLGGTKPIQWKKQIIDNSFLQAHEVYAYDLDGDNDTDIIGASAQSNTITLWRNDGGNPINWTKQNIGTNFRGARSIAIDDIDGDNDFDVVGAALTDNEITWWRNDGGDPIVWTEFPITTNFNGAHKVCLFDMDGDQDLDILGTAYAINQIAWWRNDGGDPISWSKIIVTNTFTTALIAYPQDIDLDGKVDIVGTSQGLNQVAWWKNKSSKTYEWEKYIIRNSYSGVWPLFISDIDNDNDFDVVSGAHNLNQINWWENTIALGVSSMVQIPDTFKLHQNYPNPFNPVTTIDYQLPHDANVSLKIYNVVGEKIKTLVNNYQSAGYNYITWDGTDDSGNSVSSGIYIYQFNIGERNQIFKRMKMLYLK